MTTVDDFSRFLDAFAPLRMAESWDNVGLLLGDRQRPVARLMTCLTITAETAREAIAEKVDLIVTHHPLPFAPLKRITTETAEGNILWLLAGAGISVFSPHTAFDSAPEGINQRLAVGLGLDDIEPLTARTEDFDGRKLGAGRYGTLRTPVSLSDVVDRLQGFLDVEHVQVVGDLTTSISKVAVGCGSAGDFLAEATRAGCDCFVTGEARFHTALAAQAAGMCLVLAGHYASERFALEWLAEVLTREFPNVDIWASRAERDPLVWI